MSKRLLRPRPMCHQLAIGSVLFANVVSFPARSGSAQTRTQGTALSPRQLREQHFAEYPEVLGAPEILRSSRIPAWLQFDGELRGRIEGQSALSGKADRSAAYVLTRVRGGVHVTPTPHASLYLQFQDTHALGLPLPQVSSNMRNTFDLYQGYIDLQVHRFRLISGRQELRFGSERLIGVSDFTNNARSFDGFDLRIGGANRIDLFSASVVTVHPTSLDTHGSGLSFHGAYATLPNVLPGLSLQPFLLVSTAGNVKDSLGHSGEKAEFTSGAEVSGRVFHRFDVMGLIAIQRGTYASQSISAQSGLFKIAYALPKVAWATRLGLEYDHATGDDHKELSVRRTFDQQYPSNHDAFGLVDLFGFQNISQKRININVAPSKPLSVLIQAESLRLAASEDGLYGSSGSMLRPAPNGGFDTPSIGYGADFSAKYLVGDDLVIDAGYGHFLSTSSKVASASNGYLSLTYRFNVIHR